MRLGPLSLVREREVVPVTITRVQSLTVHIDAGVAATGAATQPRDATFVTRSTNAVLVMRTSTAGFELEDSP